VPKNDLNLTPTQQADLAALADDTIAPGRRAAVESWVASSPELQASYRRERATVELTRAARAGDRAPDSLRNRIEQQRRDREPRTRRPSLSLGITLAGALAAVIVALAVILPAGTPGAPSVADAAALAAHGPTQAAPGADPREPGSRLAAAVGDVYFPNWAQALGWWAVGQRRDVLGGRPAVTVYYKAGGRLLAYTILATPPLPQPHASSRMVNGVQLRTFHEGGRTIVTWRRAGHTCVLSATSVPAGELQKLASWEKL
jgi:anti-sigma factor RsiW